MVDLDMVKIGARIKELRTELSLTQSQLAKIIGSAQNTIAQYERGQSKIGMEVLVNLAVALKTTIDYLVGLTENPN